MKKIIFLFISLMLLANVLAQADSSQDQVFEDAETDVGIAPDSALYGLENAFKKISLALTFNKKAKAKKELGIARERLREIKLMIEKNKLDAAEKARISHEEISKKLKARFEDEVETDEEGIELQAEAEAEIEEQEAEIEDIKTRIEIKGELSEEQRAKLMELIENLKSNGKDIRLKVDSRKNKLKIKLKEEGLTEVEIEERIENKKEIGLDNALRNRIEHVKREIEKSREHLSQNKSGVDNDNLVELREQLDTADETLFEAEKKIEEEEYDDSKELINKALKLAVLVRGNDKRFEASREILKERLKKELGEEKLERARERLEERKEDFKTAGERLEKKMTKNSEDDEELEDEIEDNNEKDDDEESERGRSSGYGKEIN